MLRLALSYLSPGPCAIALLLATLAIAGPIVNSTGRPPSTVFLNLPQSTTPPEVHVNISSLGGGRYLLTLHASAFVFTEVCVTDANARPIGHAHVHVDGEKVASAYTPIVEIGPLEPGVRTVDIVLRGQDHRPIVARNGLVQRRIQIRVPAEAA